MASDKVKGSSKRLIEVPGYHIKPKWDLVHTRHILHEKRTKKKNFALMLAPMVDMFSILVIYLIMNFSTTGEAFFISRDIQIPQATRGAPMESYPLISVVKDKVFFDADRRGSNERMFIEELNDGQSPQLREALRRIKELEIQIGGEKGFRGQVNLQADRTADVEEVKKIMRLLIEEGWTVINFIIEPTVGSG